MKRTLLSAMFVTIICLAQVPSAYASRHVKAEIILDGKVILEGGTSDDGRRDADELWDALKTIKFKPTLEFRKLNINEEAMQAVIKSTSPKGEEVNLRIKLKYGGEAITPQLRINRIPFDAQLREWVLDADDVTDLFDRRKISRDEAAKLVNPKRTK